MAAGFAPKARRAPAPRSHSQYPAREWRTVSMPDLRPIVLVEDNPKDIELTLAALAKCQLANDIVVLRDGAEVLDYLNLRGAYAHRAPGSPAVVLLDLKLP